MSVKVRNEYFTTIARLRRVKHPSARRVLIGKAKRLRARLASLDPARYARPLVIDMELERPLDMELERLMLPANVEEEQ